MKKTFNNQTSVQCTPSPFGFEKKHTHTRTHTRIRTNIPEAAELVGAAPLQNGGPDRVSDHRRHEQRGGGGNLPRHHRQAEDQTGDGIGPTGRSLEGNVRRQRKRQSQQHPRPEGGRAIRIFVETEKESFA
jgi:hypothetical protein